MFRNYLLIFFRNISRNKTFSFLNIGGFSLGMAACILIMLFISNEKKFDKFHSKGDRIYRLNEWQRFNGMQEQLVALSMLPMGPALQKDYPEVESYVRIESVEKAIVKESSKQVFTQHLLFVDSTFFHLFDFPLVSGNKEQALESPTSVVLSELSARKIFGTVNAIGKQVETKLGDDYRLFTVSAVLKDVPAHSHLQFDMLVPMSAMEKRPWMDTWESNWINTYILLKENADVEKLRAALPAFEKTYLKEEEKFYDLVLQPFQSIHLHSENVTHDDMNFKKFSYAHIRTFLILAVAILLIAVFNFVNLSTALAVKRAKEAGIRKTIGAGNWQLIRQFTAEALLFSFISFLVALLVTFISLPLINSVFDRNIQLELVQYADQWIFAILAVIVIGVLSGIYPAFLVSRFKPITMMKGVSARGPRRTFSLRHVLVIIQFTIAVGLIISAVVITQQLQFAHKKDMGFNKEQVLLVGMNGTANKKYQGLRHSLLANNSIEDVTAYNERLGRNINQYGAVYKTRTGEEKGVSVSHLYVDYNYLDFFKIKLVKGRNFSPVFSDTAGRSYIMNETLVKEMEIDEPIGTPYRGSWLKEMGSVIGVVRDFNFNSLHHKIAPLYISIQNWDFSEMAIRLKKGNTEAAVSYVENLWKKEVPDMPFTYSFLDEHMNTLYAADKQAGKVVNMAMLLAIIVACLGLFGMALYTINTRVKEIGVRKVLGASVGGIAFTLSVEFLKLVVISAAIAFPLAWWAMNKWLQDFAFRIQISWWVFIIAGLSAIVIAMLTISFQSIRAALANPVKSLRTE